MKVYIGQTGSCLKLRPEEHQRALSNWDVAVSAIAEYALPTSHVVDLSKSSVLDCHQHTTTRCHIQKSSDNLNREHGALPEVYKALLDWMTMWCIFHFTCLYYGHYCSSLLHYYHLLILFTMYANVIHYFANHKLSLITHCPLTVFSSQFEVLVTYTLKKAAVSCWNVCTWSFLASVNWASQWLCSRLVSLLPT